MICEECGVSFKGGRFWVNGSHTPWRKCPDGHRFLEPQKQPRPPRPTKAGACHDKKDVKEQKKKSVMRPCIGCKQMFLSWDRTKNQRCQKCRTMSDNNIFY